MSVPSAKAIEAANRAFGPSPLDPPDDMRTVLEAAHDSALGLDRSVCLRDVVEALGGEWAKGRLTNWETQQDAAIYIERKFGGSGGH